MLEAARELDRDGRVEWVQSDLREWDPRIVWAGRRRGDQRDAAVGARATSTCSTPWVGALAEGGWFAMQVPGNFDAPSPPADARDGRAPRAGWRARRRRWTCRRWATRRPTCATSAALGCEVDAWETTYLHVLDPEGERREPGAEWVAATGLRPVIEILTDEDELAAFVDPYVARRWPTPTALAGRGVFLLPAGVRRGVTSRSRA